MHVEFVRNSLLAVPTPPERCWARFPVSVSSAWFHHCHIC